MNKDSTIALIVRKFFVVLFFIVNVCAYYECGGIGTTGQIWRSESDLWSTS